MIETTAEFKNGHPHVAFFYESTREYLIKKGYGRRSGIARYCCKKRGLEATSDRIANYRLRITNALDQLMREGLVSRQIIGAGLAKTGKSQGGGRSVYHWNGRRSLLDESQK